MTVADMKPNQTGFIVRIDAGHGLSHRLETRGIRPGVAITKKSTQPLRGPVTIQVGGAELALGFGIARRIIVEVGG